MRRKVLISGALGYVGGRVSRHLAAGNEFELLLGTRRITSAPRWLRHGRVVELDVLDSSSLDAVCDGVESVLHLAAVNEHVCASDPVEAVRVNVIGTVKLLEAAIRGGVKRFLYMSTAHVYGEPLSGRITEETPPKPVHPYAVTHRAAEDFVRAAHEKRSLQGIVLRLSNGFGAPERPEVNRWTLIVNELCRQVATTKTITMRSAGQEWRDFVTLEDVGRAVAHCLDMPDAAIGDGVFNLGGEAPTRIIDLVGLIADRCDAVLDFRPQIRTPDGPVQPRAEKLDYRIDKLKSTGFRLHGDMVGEIDATLHLCHDAFASRR